MNPHEATSPSAKERLSSVVTRAICRGQPVYIKRLSEDGWEGTAPIIRARSAREADAIRRVGQIPQLRGRLGTVRLVESRPESATIVTAEVPGRPLDEWLDEFCRHGGKRAARAFFLAGRWLRVFQTLPFSEYDDERIGQNSPLDLVEYCNIRLNKLQTLGYRWVSSQRSRQVLQAVDALRRQSDSMDQRLVWCHGDYSPGNVLWDGVVLTAIDFAMANLDVPLVDVTYFVHRLEMLAVYFPWRRWPIPYWKNAFLRGYGRRDAELSPMFRALMIRHWLCRLQTYVRRPTYNLKQRLHNAWVRRAVRTRLRRLLENHP